MNTYIARNTNNYISYNDLDLKEERIMNNRIQEIKSKLTAFSQEKYRKKDMKDEYIKLQRQVVGLVMGEEAVNDKSIDVRKVMEVLREGCAYNENVDEKLINSVMYHLKKLSNAISSEIRGLYGETIVSAFIDNIDCNKLVLKGIELESDGIRTEIDNLVITKRGAFIIEVKNTASETIIGADGSFSKKSVADGSEVFEGNIYEKMVVKESLVKKAIKAAVNKEVRVSHIVVFPDHKAQVTNNCENINVRTLAELEEIIKDTTKKKIYTENDMQKIADSVTSFEDYSYYIPNINAPKLKTNLATLMAQLTQHEIDEEDSRSFGMAQPVVISNTGKKMKMKYKIIKSVANWLMDMVPEEMAS